MRHNSDGCLLPNNCNAGKINGRYSEENAKPEDKRKDTEASDIRKGCNRSPKV